MSAGRSHFLVPQEHDKLWFVRLLRERLFVAAMMYVIITGHNVLFLRTLFVLLSCIHPSSDGQRAPSGPGPSDRRQLDRHVFRRHRPRTARRLALLDAKRPTASKQHLQRAQPQRPQRHVEQPERLASALGRQPGVSQRRGARARRVLSLRGQ